MGLKLSPKSTKSHEKLFYGLSTGEDIEYRTNIHSCEKLKHHFFEVSFQKKMLFWCSFSSSCSTKALFSDSEVCWIFLIVFWGWHPDKWQFSKVERKNWEKLDFFEAMQWATLKFMSKVHLWLSFGYLFELAVSDENYPFYTPIKFSSSLRRANIATWKIPLIDIVSKALPSVACKFEEKISNFNPLFGLLSLTLFWNHPIWGSEHAWKFWSYPIHYSPWSLQLIDTLILPAWGWGRTAVKPSLASTLPKGGILILILFWPDRLRFSNLML